MKITEIRTRLFEYRLERRRGDAHAPSGRTHQNGLLVELLTDSELVGLTVAAPSAGPAIASLSGAVIGRDPRQVRGIWQTMANRVFKAGNVGLMNDALSALDTAVWDLKGKIHGEPVWRLLGAGTNRVLAYASGGDMPLTIDQLVEFYTYMAGLGFAAAKLKIGLDIEEDARRLAAVRDAMARVLGRPPALMVDASEYWHPKQAVRRICRLEEEFDLTWVEEPVQRADYIGLATVSRHIKAPVAAGENLDNVMEFLPYVQNGSADIVQIGRGMGGLTGALQVAELANGHGLPVIGSDSVGKHFAHLAAALSNHMMIEVHDAHVEEPMIIADNRIEDGHVVLGDSPGLGLTIDRDRLERYGVSALRTRSGYGWAGRRAGAGLIEVPASAEEKRVGAIPPGEELV